MKSKKNTKAEAVTAALENKTNACLFNLDPHDIRNRLKVEKNRLLSRNAQFLSQAYCGLFDGGRHD